jgi:zinc transporter ZupT
LSAGWSPLKVGIFQVISQSTAFIGLYIGISVSETSSTAEEWILALAAGLFLYVALADVVSLKSF